MRNLLIVFCTLILISSCSKSEDPIRPAETALTQINVNYGNDALQKFDLYLPANRNTAATRLIILIHGGGWNEGDKTDFNPFIDTLKTRFPGWAFANINYRLATFPAINIFPTQENDVKSCLEYIYSKRNEYAISDKWVLLGASAGGHLSLLQGYKYDMPIKPKAIVNFFGPCDMADMYNHPASAFVDTSMIRQLMSGTPVTNPVLYQQSSPLNFVNAQSPATLTLQGGADPLVPAYQQETLHNKLNSFNVPNQLKIYPGESHGWVGANLVNSFDLIQQFLNQYVP
ncbi:MAG: alpha/beta hydrolase [Niastella sp.]|nr:alpha/beta hydrolase [Niastella sp.]